MECIFCKIVAGEIPVTPIYSDADVLAFADANPQAPVHLLVVPRTHYANLVELMEADDPALLARIFSVAAQIGRERGEHGFRTIVNTGPDGGQTVEHMHVHVLAGRHFTWPPG